MLFSNSGVYSQKVDVNKDLHKEIQLKTKETDEQSRTMTVKFSPLERFEFDSEGREIYYEDLSLGEGFYEIYDYYIRAELKDRQTDKKRITKYDKQGNRTSFLREKADGEEENIIREFDKKGKPIHIRGNMGEFQELFDSLDMTLFGLNGEEAWFDKSGNVTHTINEYGIEEWFKYDRKSNLLHSWDNKGTDTKYEYDKNGNLVYIYTILPKTRSNSIYDLISKTWMTYSADNKVLTEKWEAHFYDDETYTNQIGLNSYMTQYEYDRLGRLLKEISSDIASIDDDEFQHMVVSYRYSADGRTVTERIEDLYYEDAEFTRYIEGGWEEVETLKDEKDRPLHILRRGAEIFDEDDPDTSCVYEQEEWYSYDADGTAHWKDDKGNEKAFSPKGNLIYKKENYDSNEWSEEFYRDNDKEQTTYYTKYRILKEGTIDVLFETWNEYDEAGRETHYKCLDYSDKRHPQEETWHEYTAGGNLLHKKKFSVEYVDPETNLYSSTRTEKTEEEIYTFDDHENELSLELYHDGKKDDYSRKGSYKYDDKGRMTYEFHGNYTDGKLGENTEGWYEYDDNGYLTRMKVKAYSTRSFGSYKPESVPTKEYFFVNQYSYHKNGKIKDCIRYYYKNEFYERDWQPDMLRLDDIEEAKKPKKPVLVHDPMTDGKEYVEEIRFESSSKYIGINDNFWGVVANSTAPVYTNLHHRFGDEPEFTLKKGDAVRLHALSKDGFQYGSGDFFHRWKIETDDGKTGWISGHDLIPVGMRKDVPPLYSEYFVVVGSYPGYLMGSATFTLCVTGSSYGSMGYYNGDIRYDTGMTGDTPYYMEGYVLNSTNRKRAYRWDEEKGCFVAEYSEKTGDSGEWKILSTSGGTTRENETILRVKGYYYSEEYYAVNEAIENNDMNLLSKVIASGYKAGTMHEDQSPLTCALSYNNQAALDMMLQNGFSRYVYVSGEDDMLVVDIDEFR